MTCKHLADVNTSWGWNCRMCFFVLFFFFCKFISSCKLCGKKCSSITSLFSMEVVCTGIYHGTGPFRNLREVVEWPAILIIWKFKMSQLIISWQKFSKLLLQLLLIWMEKTAFTVFPYYYLQQLKPWKTAVTVGEVITVACLIKMWSSSTLSLQTLLNTQSCLLLLVTSFFSDSLLFLAFYII